MSPVVDGKEFDYGKKGLKAAKAEAKRTGKPMKMKPPKGKPGRKK